MATLTRTRAPSAQVQVQAESLIDSHIPSPFPSHLLDTVRQQDQNQEISNPGQLIADPFADQVEEQQQFTIDIDSGESVDQQSQSGSQEQTEQSRAEVCRFVCGLVSPSLKFLVPYRPSSLQHWGMFSNHA